jgi:HSP20 family protein
METIMSLTKKDVSTAWPTEMTTPEDRADRLFRDMVRDFFSGGALLDRFTGGWANPLHLEEYLQDGTCVIRAELPGIDPDKDVEISVASGIVNIRAHREERSEEERPDGYRSEFRYGSFQRTVRLPEGATEKDVKAAYKDGILEIRVPVETSDKSPTRVSVEHS